MPTWLIEPAIDLNLFASIEPRPARAPDAPLRVISVGRLAWQKGYEFAIDAIAKGEGVLPVYQAGPMNTTGQVPSVEVVSARAKDAATSGAFVVLDRAYPGFEYARRVAATRTRLAGHEDRALAPRAPIFRSAPERRRAGRGLLPGEPRRLGPAALKAAVLGGGAGPRPAVDPRLPA